MYAGTGGDNDVATADFNGDGKLDLAVISVLDEAGNGRVAIYLGDGHGGFTPASGSPLTPGNNPWSVTIGDFNGDGKLDLAVCNDGAANHQLDSISIFLGDGHGGFSQAPGSPLALPANTGPISIRVADFNRDGKLDLVTANLHNATVTAFLGNGDGTFTPAPGSPISIPGMPWSVAIADFNRDNKPDVVVGTYGGGVYVLLGDGTGNFTSAPGSPFNGGSGPYHVAAGDFNGDGIPDVAVANWNTVYLGLPVGSVTLLLGNADGSLRTSNNGPYPFNGYASGIVTADLNQDGKTDIAVVAYDGQAGNVLLGDGTGGFTVAPGSPFLEADLSNTMALGDFDGDGTPDMVFAGGTVSLNWSKPPVLTISGSHTGSFTQGQLGAYSLVVANTALAGPTRGTVTVTEMVPAGLLINSMAGTGWVCSMGACSRSDTLANGVAYPPITVTVSASLGAPSQVVNVATVSSSGAATVSATDTTTISQLSQSIIFGVLPFRTYGSGAFAVSAFATSGLAVAFGSLSSSVCTVSGNLVRIVGAGACSIAASQSGNAVYSSAATVTQTFLVNKASLTLAATNISKPYGGPLPALGFTVSGFVNGDTQAVLSGAPSLSTTAAASSPVGSYPIVVAPGTLFAANYSFALVPGLLAVTQAGTITTLVMGNSGQVVATISVIAPGAGMPTGTVQLLNGSTVLATAVLQGSAAILPSSPGSLTAIYSGDPNFTGSGSQAILIYPPAQSAVTVSSSSNPSSLGQAVTLTAAISSSGGSPLAKPSGAVQFSDGSAPLATVNLSGGQAAYTTSALSSGSHSIIVQYSGDSTFPASQAAYVQTVTAPITMAASSSPSTAAFGQTIVLTANVAATVVPPGLSPPSGQVLFLLEGNSPFAPSTQLGTSTLTAGTATLSVSTLAVGANYLIFQYLGDAAWPAISRQIVVNVSPAPTKTAVSLAMVSGQLVLTGEVLPLAPGGGAPTGILQFLDTSNHNSVVASANLSGGKAVAQLAATAIPQLSGRPIAGAYSGDTNFSASVSAPLPFVGNAASYLSTSMAPDGIATGFGIFGLNGDVVATLPPPTALAGASVTITDSAGTERPALLYGAFSSSGQVNFVVPSGTAEGPAAVAVASPRGGVVNTVIGISPSAPGFFTADGSGVGAYAGQVVYVHASGSQTVASSAEAVPGANTVAAVPINLSTPGDQVYLILYGTGIRHAGGLTASVNGVSVPVTYFGAQGSFPGLDQLNLGPLPLGLAGSGTVSLTVAVDGQTANPVKLVVQ